ncbi:MAG: Wzz/FepE/Etk N-terminal domain-containing protein [Rhodospirillales bacterium]
MNAPQPVSNNRPGDTRRQQSRSQPAPPSYGLRDLLTEIFYNRPLVMTTLAIPIVAGIVATFFLPTIYDVTARLLVLVSREHVAGGGLGNAGFAQSFDAQARIVQAEAQILRSRGLREEAIRIIGPETAYPAIAASLIGKENEEALIIKAAERLDMDTEVQLVPGTNVLSITYEHPDPRIAARMLNTIVDLYIARRQEIFTDVTPAALTDELTRLETNIAEIDADLRMLRTRSGVSDIDAQRAALIARLNQFQSAQISAGVDTEALFARVAELEQSIDRIPEKVDLFVDDGNTTAMNNALDNVRELELERAKLADRYQDGSRFIREIDERLDVARRIVETFQKLRIDRERKGRNTVYDNLLQQIISLSGERQAVEAKMDALESAIEVTSRQLGRLDEVESEFRKLQLRRLVLSQSYTEYAGRVQQERLARALENAFEDPTIRVIERAEVPVEGRSIRLQVLVLSIIVGIGLTAGIVYVRAISRAVFISAEGAHRSLDLHVFAIDEKRSGGELNLFMEMNRLYFMLDPPIEEDYCVIMQIVGATPNEGTSTVAREFALVAAQQIAGDVLLLDLNTGKESQFDTISERLTDRFGEPGAPEETSVRTRSLWRSTSQALDQGSTAIDMTLHRLGHSNLVVSRIDPDSLTSAGTIQLNTGDGFWQSLHGNFRLAIIDSPSLIRNYDGLSVSKRADATMLVITAEKTRKPVAELLRDRVTENDGYVSALIFNRRRRYIPSIFYKLL